MRGKRRTLARRIGILTLLLAGSLAQSGCSGAGRPGFARFYFERLREKFDRFRNLDEDNERLRARVVALELESARLARERIECAEQLRSDRLRSEAKQEGGVETARTVASLKPSDKDLLSKPDEKVFSESAAAFAKGDTETAAVGLAALADKERTAQLYYLAGVSLYKVGNFKRALSALRKAAAAATGDSVSYAPRAMGWIALCQAGLGDKAAAARAAKDLIQAYPRSKEARRLNRAEAADVE